MDAIQLEARADEGLFSLLHRAAEAIGRWPQMLILELTGSPDCAFTVEATLSEQLSKRTVERLDARLRTTIQLDRARPTLARALTQFGGTDFTSITLGVAEQELMDATVAFGKIPWLARNIGLFSGDLTEYRRQLGEVLDRLGIRSERTGSSLRLPKFQLRAGLEELDQVGALDAVASGPFHHCVLYGSPLPPVHSVRIELKASESLGTTPRCALDLTLSRGWAKGSTLSPSEAEAIERIIYDPALALSVRGTFRISTPGSKPNEPYRPHAVLGHRPRTEYSVNWGTKRR